MANYESLQIFAVSYDFLVYITELIRSYPREYKYLIGDELHKLAIEVTLDIYRVNSCFDELKKIDIITEIEYKMQKIFLILRVSHDLKLISTQRQTTAGQKVLEMTSQAKKWKKYYLSKNKLVDENQKKSVDLTPDFSELFAQSLKYDAKSTDDKNSDKIIQPVVKTADNKNTQPQDKPKAVVTNGNKAVSKPVQNSLF